MLHFPLRPAPLALHEAKVGRAGAGAPGRRTGAVMRYLARELVSFPPQIKATDAVWAGDLIPAQSSAPIVSGAESRADEDETHRLRCKVRPEQVRRVQNQQSESESTQTSSRFLFLKKKEEKLDTCRLM